MEVSGLASVRWARGEAIIDSYWDVWFLQPIPIHVAKQEIERAVRVLFPTLVRWGDTLAL
tara:strand:- start:183 stop:362 length:180 start_codon:yes stop_codon:yes gene_type:complete